jgi:tetratricopeptide (TPR) repeat protein
MRPAPLSFGIALALAGVSLLASEPKAAALVDLPRAVPTAKLTQQVGLTEISVEYDCPAVKGRKIWGAVVPFGAIWTIGANPAARIKFSKDVSLGEQAVPAGTYWLLALPTKSTWTVVLNKSPDPIASARDYKPELDVARMKVSPKPGTPHERLMFSFSDLTDDHASLNLEWEALRVPIPIQVNTTQQMLASIDGLDETWRSFANAARYMLETKKDYDAGLKYIDQALALRDDWYCLWVKAALLAAKGDFGSAHDWAEKARELSERVGNGAALAPDLARAIAEWGRKSGRPDVEAHALKKAGDGAPPTGSGPQAAYAEPPAFAPQVFKATSNKETSASKDAPEVPGGDPPLRRARLRHR